MRHLWRLVLTTLALSTPLLIGCRVETVRSLSREQGRNSLFYEKVDSARKGTVRGPLAFGMGFTSLEPPRPTSLAGFGGAARRLLAPNYAGADGFFTYCVPYENIDLAPRAKVLLWQGKDASGRDEAFALVAIDVVAVPSDVARKLVARLSEAYPRLRLDHGNVQIVASHTHAGPAGLTENPFWGAFACDRYSQELWEFFEARVLQAFRLAVADKKPVVSAARRTANIPGLNKSRFKGMEVDSRLLTMSFSGAVDPLVTSGQPTSRQGIPCLQVFAVHPTFFGQNRLTLSSDAVGHAERELALVNRGSPCVFLNGAVGNADATADDGIEDWAQRFAEIAFNPATGDWSDAGDTIEFGARVIDLPTPKPNLKACGVPPIDALVSARILENLPPRTKVSFARIGRTLLAFYPGEPVRTVSLALEKAILAKRPDVDVVQVLGVSNDYLGYVVDSDAFNEKALESCSTLYGRRVADTLRDAFVVLVTP